MCVSIALRAEAMDVCHDEYSLSSAGHEFKACLHYALTNKGDGRTGPCFSRAGADTDWSLCDHAYFIPSILTCTRRVRNSMRRLEHGQGEWVANELENLVLTLGQTLRGQGLRMATAESCTGGLVASTLTDVAGSSDWFQGGIVAYGNEVKQRLLSVPEDVIARHGAVSQACVEGMVRGVCRLLDVPVGLAVSGIAGPGGGTLLKPVGTVWMAWEFCGRVWSREFLFTGSRRDIKTQSAWAAIEELVRG
jgi:nicotinamide-nucleotide amidase